MHSQYYRNASLLVGIPAAKRTVLSSVYTVCLCWILKAAPTNPFLHQMTAFILSCLKKAHIFALVRVTLLPRRIIQGSTSQQPVSRSHSVRSQASKILPLIETQLHTTHPMTEKEQKIQPLQRPSQTNVLCFSNSQKASVTKIILLKLFDWYWDYLTMDMESSRVESPTPIGQQ